MATRTVEKIVTTCDAYIERTRGIKRYELAIVQILPDGTRVGAVQREADLCAAGLKRATHLLKKAISPVGKRAKEEARATADLEGQEVLDLEGQAG